MAESDWIDDPSPTDGDWVDDNEISGFESGARGLAQGASLGFADEITGGIESLFSGKTYQQARDESRKNYEASQKANPMTYGAGEIGGAVGTAFIPGLGAANSAKLAALAGKGALAGGLAGLGTSEADLTKGDYSGSALDAAKGAALGGALGIGASYAGKGLQKLGKGLQNISSDLGNRASDIAELQSARALGAERGTIKKIGADKVREIGRFGLDEGIVSPLASTDDLIARNDAAKKLGASKMKEVYSAIDDAGVSTFNPQNVAEKVNDELGGFWRSPINKGETKQLDNMLESILIRGDGNIPLIEAQALKQELGKVASWKNNVAVSDKEKMARDAYGIVSKAIDDATDLGASAIGTDGLLDTLKQGKSLYGNAKGAEELLDNKFAREQGNKMFGLTDTIAGGAGVAGGPATALGLVGLKKGAERYGNQLLATGANNISKILKQAPQSLGKFANVLQQAEQRGPKGVAATHFILQQTNPEYRQTFMRAAGAEEEDNWDQ